jgi:photosystem II stability/assembly factor-like uncharacterized protein
MKYLYTFSRCSILFLLLFYGNINAQGWVQYGTNGQLPSFYSLSAVNDSVCWFSGDLMLTVLVQIQSTGNTYTWSQNGLEPAAYTAICGRSSSLAYTGSQDGKLFKTTNGGGSWVKQYALTSKAYIDGIYFWDDNLGIAFGDPAAYPGIGPFTILRTTDGGSNWNDISASTPSVTGQFGYNQCFDAVGSHFWFTSELGSGDTTIQRYLFHSSDYGATWEKMVIPLNFGDSSPAFSDPSNGILTSYYGHTARTTDGGKTWSVKYVEIGNHGLAIQKGTPNVWVGGFWDQQANYSPIYFSSDFGTTWNKQPKQSATVLTGSAVTQNVVWASGYNYTILRNTNPTLTSITVKNNLPLPLTFDLKQNYPNPFNPITTIKYHIEKQGSTKLVVYDALGRDVRTLVNDSQAAGWHMATWDGTNDSRQPVATGTYFYRIEGNGQAMTKKMILLK